MSADAVCYLDSSALVKLVVREPESATLTRHLRSRPVRVSCALATVEVVRAVGAHGPEATDRARQVLDGVDMIRLDDPLLHAAATLDGPLLRSLDAIHLAAALALREDEVELITYDRRMAAHAEQLGFVVSAPA
ncbi:type II toxin-antitoxin system VapC family toxin [Conexibacter woesei]|uniref:Ribonuclease VapC n=1 Tax=Conexibacter woesei (strain DSM 14684 / CCUG 47730 / CIP 108061 / JCM 11494 / NBRC 100937 / ID131577) TaxID=469383 RepID=D3FBX1_CONWI|nr:type II toxin-antitoxin system VapC family toxin [Conexibacter woesei]ADB51386.1 conserved hypothetical protein [Conexibacter woesei DSM 14684]